MPQISKAKDKISICWKKGLFHSEQFIETFRTAFQEAQPYKGLDGMARVEMGPRRESYPVAVMQNVFDSDFLRRVKQELLTLPFSPKHNDLYRFSQAPDLQSLQESDDKDCIHPESALLQLKHTFASETFIQWISHLTGLELTHGKLDMAGQCYSQGDHLLCHDDDIANEELGRRIAFILYLVPLEWTEKDGGCLEIFSRDHKHMPTHNVAARLVPQWNTFAFFEVTPTSYHQVAEVLSADHERISITGWFYGPLAESRKQWPEIDRAPSSDQKLEWMPIARSSDAHANDEHEIGLLQDWINPEYLKEESMDQISSVFVDESYVELMNFLREDRFLEVSRAFVILSDPDMARSLPDSFPLLGPPNVRRYTRVQIGNLTDEAILADPEDTKEMRQSRDVLEKFQKLLQSQQFIRLVESFTNLEVKAFQLEQRIFREGDYTLLHDHVREKTGGLDLYMDFTPVTYEPAKKEEEDNDQDSTPPAKRRKEEFATERSASFDGEESDEDDGSPWDECAFGGAVTYMDEDEHLLSIVPFANKLSLVYRDESGVVMHYVKYLSHQAPCDRRDTAMVFEVK